MTIVNGTGFGGDRHITELVTFGRAELGVILQLYGRMVAAGEWKDYGIAHLREAAVFSIFRRHAEFPLWRVEKRPRLADRQGLYCVVGMDGRILKRGNDLSRVLKPLERPLLRVVRD